MRLYIFMSNSGGKQVIVITAENLKSAWELLCLTFKEDCVTNVVFAKEVFHFIKSFRLDGSNQVIEIDHKFKEAKKKK